jgi:hypothetical protein
MCLADRMRGANAVGHAGGRSITFAKPVGRVVVVRHERPGSFSFQWPSDWTRWWAIPPDVLVGGPSEYFSTDALLPACATREPPVSFIRPSPAPTCDWPLESLSPNGVLATWESPRILAWLPSAGEPVTMSTGIARLQVDLPGTCAQVGGDETLSVLIPIDKPARLSNVGFLGCLRGPDLAIGEAQFRAFLMSITITP